MKLLPLISKNCLGKIVSHCNSVTRSKNASANFKKNNYFFLQDSKLSENCFV